MSQLFAIAARSALMANIAAGDTNITIDLSKADLFPVANTDTSAPGTPGKDWFKVALEDSSKNIEIVYVRTRALGAASLTNCLRGQEGTTARAYLAGSIVGLRHTAQDMAGAIDLASSTSSFWKTVLGALTAAASRVALGVSVVGDALFTAADQAAGRSALGLGNAATGTIGTTVQAYDAATAKTNAAQVFTAQQTPAGAAATAGAGTTYTWAVGAAQVLELTFGAGNITTFSVSGAVAKTSYRLVLKQDSVGGRTWATTGIKWPGGVAPILSTAPNAVDIFDFYYDGTSMNCVGQNIGEA